MENYRHFLFGGISGLAEVCISHPIDLYKTKSQEYKLKNKRPPNIFNFFQHRFGKYGFQKGFYSGYIPRITGVIPMRTVFWGVQSYSNNLLLEKYGDGNVGIGNEFTISSTNRYIISGVLAGSFQTIIDTPIELMKIRLMTGQDSLSSLRFRELFAGFMPNYWRNIVFAAGVSFGANQWKNNSPAINFLTTASCAFAASVITQPLDFIKTSQQRYLSKNEAHNKQGGKSIKLIRFLSQDFSKNFPKIWVGTFSRASLGFINMGVGAITIIFLEKFYQKSCNE